MGDHSKIEWTGATWNPIVGCTRVSPGCDHCYAIPTVARGEAMGTAQHAGLTVRSEERLDWNGKVTVVDHLLDKPLRWRKPRRIFVNSLSDLFHPDVDDYTIARIFAVMALASQHTFQVLTKRPQRMAHFFEDPANLAQTCEIAEDMFVAALTPQQRRVSAAAGGWWAAGIEAGWPLPNVWLGTSIESDRYAFRADYLRRTPAAVRFISAEPLLGPLPSLDLTGIDWLIVGGESGPGALPMHPDWVRDLRDRCHPAPPSESCPEAPADDPGHCGHWYDCEPCHRCGDDTIDHGCDCPRCTAARPPAFFFKQWGEWGPLNHMVDILGQDAPVFERARREVERGGPCTVWSHEARMVRVGKAAAGRVLDGRTWDEVPERVS